MGANFSSGEKSTNMADTNPSATKRKRSSSGNTSDMSEAIRECSDGIISSIEARYRSLILVEREAFFSQETNGGHRKEDDEEEMLEVDREESVVSDRRLSGKEKMILWIWSLV